MANQFINGNAVSLDITNLRIVMTLVTSRQFVSE
jgi:hypothetical protein